MKRNTIRRERFPTRRQSPWRAASAAPVDGAVTVDVAEQVAMAVTAVVVAAAAAAAVILGTDFRGTAARTQTGKREGAAETAPVLAVKRERGRAAEEESARLLPSMMP